MYNMKGTMLNITKYDYDKQGKISKKSVYTDENIIKKYTVFYY